VDLPTGWREVAAEHGLVLVFVGHRLGLRDHTEGQQRNPGQRSSQAAGQALGRVLFRTSLRYGS
jgi:hypothetical protein